MKQNANSQNLSGLDIEPVNYNDDYNIRKKYKVLEEKLDELFARLEEDEMRQHDALPSFYIRYSSSESNQRMLT